MKIRQHWKWHWTFEKDKIKKNDLKKNKIESKKIWLKIKILKSTYFKNFYQIQMVDRNCPLFSWTKDKKESKISKQNNHFKKKIISSNSSLNLKLSEHAFLHVLKEKEKQFSTKKKKKSDYLILRCSSWSWIELTKKVLCGLVCHLCNFNNPKLKFFCG